MFGVSPGRKSNSSDNDEGFANHVLGQFAEMESSKACKKCPWLHAGLRPMEVLEEYRL